MGWSSIVRLECDDCGAEADEDVGEVDRSPEDVIDNEGWSLTGTLLNRLLCPECAEKEEDE